MNPRSEDSRRRAPGSLAGDREERLVRPWAGDNQREVLRLVDRLIVGTLQTATSRPLSG